MDNIELNFEFENAYRQREETVPGFLRNRGIKGVLRSTKKARTTLDKVKLVLKGALSPLFSTAESVAYCMVQVP
jgi:hypothetical protein